MVKRKLLRKGAWGMCILMLQIMIFAGCSSQEQAKGDQDVTEKTETETVEKVSGEKAGNFNAEGLPIVDEKVTFTIAVEQMSSLKSAAEKACVIDTEEATNVHIEWIEIPTSGWSEKINIMFSTDSLPDAIIGNIDMTRNYEQLVALDDYLEEYAPNVTAFFDTRDDYPQALRAPDGKIRALPNGDETSANMIDSLFWINQNWLDRLSLDMPETPEELKEVLIAFRDQDPNGDGLQNEIPFTFQDAWGWARSIENLFGAFGVLENDDHVFTRDGEVIFSAREQGYYDTLIYLNDLYREGLIDKDDFTLSSDQYAARGASGDILGLVAGYRSSDAGVYDTEAYQVLPILKQEDGSQMVGINNVTKTGGFVITQSCKNPEILVRWYDYINSSLELALEWGRGAEGVAWNIVEVDGEEVAQQLTMDSEVLKANGGYSSAAEYRAAESFAGVTPSLYRYEYFEKQIKDEDIRSEAIKEQIPYGVTGLPAGTASQENEEQRSILLTDIDTYLKKFVADSVINGIDDAKWQEHLDTLESLKVDEYTRLCQEFVDSMAE